MPIEIYLIETSLLNINYQGKIMNKLKQLFIVFLSAVFLNNNIISMEQAKSEQEILSSDS